MSQYVSRTLADRRKREQSGKIAKRIGLCLFLLIFGLTSAMVGYMFLAYTDQIAANTHDTWQTIGSLGAMASFLSFCAFLLIPIVAFGIHES